MFRLYGNITNICHCTRLKRLVLSYNNLTGQIDPLISKLSNLELFYLNNNKMDGFLPTEIGSLTQLQFLNLADNDISGSLPEELCSLTELRLCVLSRNNICGPAPRNLTKLTKLKDFNVFTSFPSESLKQPRGFDKESFERVYGWGPSVGIDSVHWATTSQNQSTVIAHSSNNR